MPNTFPVLLKRGVVDYGAYPCIKESLGELSREFPVRSQIFNDHAVGRVPHLTFPEFVETISGKVH